MQLDIMEALRRMIVDTGNSGRLARRMRKNLGWQCSEAAARSRLAHMLSPDYPDRFPLELAPAAIEIAGYDELTPLLLDAGRRVRERKEPRARLRLLQEAEQHA